VSVANRANLFEKFASGLWSCRHLVDEAETECSLLSSLSVQLELVGTCRREYDLGQQIGHAGVLLYCFMLDGRRIQFYVGSPVLWSSWLSV